MPIKSTFKNFYTYKCGEYPFPQTIPLDFYKKYTLPENIENRKDIIETVQEIFKNENSANKYKTGNKGIFLCKNPNYLIKKRSIKNFCRNSPFQSPFPPSSNILRPVAAYYWRKIIENKNIKNIIIPKQQYIVKNNISNYKADYDKLVFSAVVCKKLDVYSKGETIQKLKELAAEKQKNLAKSIAEFIFHTGFRDTYLENMPLIKDLNTKDPKIAIIDTEPAGLLNLPIEDDTHIDGKLISLPIPLAKIRISALKNFIKNCKCLEKDNNFPQIFRKTAEKYLEKAILECKNKGKIITSRVILSIIFPIIPIILFIYAVAKCAIHQLQKWNLNSKNPSVKTPIPSKC